MKPCVGGFAGIVVTFPTITAATAGFIGKNLRYDLESTTVLTPVNWQPVAGVTNVLGEGSPKYSPTRPPDRASEVLSLKKRLA